MATKILLISQNNSYAVKKLALEAKKAGVSLSICEPNKLKGVKVKEFDVLYVRNPFVKGSPKFLNQIIALAKKFKAAGKRVVDASIAQGHLGEGKWADYQQLKKAGVKIPKTQILSRNTIPKTWPFILKWVYGFKGKNVFFINNQKHFNEAFAKYPKGELLIQEYIPARYEYKIMTVGYKALRTVLRFNIDPVTRRPDFKHYKVISNPPKQLTALAEKASKVLGRELAKVDILEAQRQLYVLEVNRFPGLDSFEELTKYNVVKDFLRYLQK